MIKLVESVDWLCQIIMELHRLAYWSVILSLLNQILLICVPQLWITVLVMPVVMDRKGFYALLLTDLAELLYQNSVTFYQKDYDYLP